MEALTRLKQTSIVAAYKAQFESLSKMLSCFLSGLKDEIRLPIRMLNLINLSAAFGLTMIQEEYVLSSRKTLRTWGYGGDAQAFGLGDRFQKGSASRKISSSHMDEKRIRGLCYHYKEKWNPIHVRKNFKVYLLQVKDSGEHLECG